MINTIVAMNIEKLVIKNLFLVLFKVIYFL